MSCVKLINFIVITEEEQILRIGMKNEYVCIKLVYKANITHPRIFEQIVRSGGNQSGESGLNERFT